MSIVSSHSTNFASPSAKPPLARANFSAVATRLAHAADARVGHDALDRLAVGIAKVFVRKAATDLAWFIVCSSSDSRTPPRRPSIVGRMPIFGRCHSRLRRLCSAATVISLLSQTGQFHAGGTTQESSRQRQSFHAEGVGDHILFAHTLGLIAKIDPNTEVFENAARFGLYSIWALKQSYLRPPDSLLDPELQLGDLEGFRVQGSVFHVSWFPSSSLETSPSPGHGFLIPCGRQAWPQASAFPSRAWERGDWERGWMANEVDGERGGRIRRWSEK